MRTSSARILLLVAALVATFGVGCSKASRMTDAATGEVTGTVTYRLRIALPPDAVIAVSLADVSRQDAAADILAEAEIPAAGRQVPIPFRVTYPLDRINPAHTYAVRARILIDGRMTMTSTTAIPVLTRGAPSEVEILVAPLSTPPAPDEARKDGLGSGDDPG